MFRAFTKILWANVALFHNFFIPKTAEKASKTKSIKDVKCAIVIPSYRPSTITYNLIESINKFSPEMKVVLVDDCTPETYRNLRTIIKLKQLAKSRENVVYLRTPVNSLKAGALNYGIDHLLALKNKPQVIVTFDDDVRINSQTLPLMIEALYSNKKIGAACSQAIVENKNVNLLTRLQALEYHSFNISKIADNGFLMGPLVMQGMLTAFRTSALKQVKGYTTGHLIEDYDITVRIKNAGWIVKVANDAQAWTTAPTTFEALWKQRVRWNYGGLRVLREFWKQPVSIFQDLIGHTIFLALLSFVILSFIFTGDGIKNPLIVTLVLVLAVINFITAFGFNVVTIIGLPNRDKKDWFIRLSIMPEFIYCNLLSLVLMGSYIFFVYNVTALYLTRKVKYLLSPYEYGLNLFQKIGFSSTWGTRQS